MNTTGFSSGLTDTELRTIMQQMDQQGFVEVHWLNYDQPLDAGQFCRRRIKSRNPWRQEQLWEIRWRTDGETSLCFPTSSLGRTEHQPEMGT